MTDEEQAVETAARAVRSHWGKTLGRSVHPAVQGLVDALDALDASRWPALPTDRLAIQWPHGPITWTGIPGSELPPGCRLLRVTYTPVEP